MPYELPYISGWKTRVYIFDDLPGEQTVAASLNNLDYSPWIVYPLCFAAGLGLGYGLYPILLAVFINLSLATLGAQILAGLLTAAIAGLVGYAICTFWNECVIPFYLTQIAGARLKSSEPLPSIFDDCCGGRKPDPAVRRSDTLGSSSSSVAPITVLPSSDDTEVSPGDQPGQEPSVS